MKCWGGGCLLAIWMFGIDLGREQGSIARQLRCDTYCRYDILITQSLIFKNKNSIR